MNVRMSLLTGVVALALTVPAAARYQTAPATPTAPETVTELAPDMVAPAMTASATVHLNLRPGPGTEHATIMRFWEGPIYPITILTTKDGYMAFWQHVRINWIAGQPIEEKPQRPVDKEVDSHKSENASPAEPPALQSPPSPEEENQQ